METKGPNTTNLLAISAHQDDIEIMAMDGILKAFGSKKYAFYACVVGDGANCYKAGKYSDISDKEMVEQRSQEQTRAGQIGEYDGLYLLKHSRDYLFKNRELVVKELAKLISDINPDIVYTHNIFDRSETHRLITSMVVDAIMTMPEETRPRLLYGCEIFRSLDWLPERYKVTFDISDNRDLQLRLVGVYDTRAEQSKNYTKAIMGRKMANAAFAACKEIDDEEKLLWYGINLTPVIQKNIALKDYCIKVLNDANKELLEGIE